MPVACDQCGLVLSSRIQLPRHILTRHTSLRPFVCHICDKTFSRKDTLLLHSRIHTDEKPFSCSRCDYASVTRIALVRHELSVHTRREDWPYSCQLCTLTFPTCNRLTKHMKTHSEKRDYKCDFCEKCFKDKSTKKDHIQNIHSSPKIRLQCEMCPKTLASKRGLRNHLKYRCSGNRQPGEGSSRANIPTKRKTMGEKSVSGSRKSPKKSRVNRDASSKSSGNKPAPGRGILTCRLCRGKFLSLPDMYRHQCPGKQ